MTQQNDILNELKELNSPLADMSRKMPYYLPESYFEELDATILSIVTEAKPEMPFFSKEMPFSVPQGYFEGLPGNVMANITLNELRKENSLYVPQGYFETLPDQILNKIKEQPIKKKTKVISFSHTMLWQQLRLGAAAVLLIGIGLGMYKYNVDKRTLNIDKALSQIPEYAINDYVSQHVDDVDAELILGTVENDPKASAKQLNEDEIIQYLNETGWGKDQSTKTENEQL